MDSLPGARVFRPRHLLQITQTVRVLSFESNHEGLRVPLRLDTAALRQDERKRARFRKQMFRIAAVWSCDYCSPCDLSESQLEKETPRVGRRRGDRTVPTLRS